MKTPTLLLCAALALAGHGTARADIPAAARLETFYLVPQPDELPRMIRELSRDGYFAQPATPRSPSVSSAPCSPGTRIASIGGCSN